MAERKKISARDFTQLIQAQLDPMYERGRLRVGPKAAPGAGHVIVMSGSSGDMSLLNEAKDLAALLDADYEVVD